MHELMANVADSLVSKLRKISDKYDQIKCNKRMTIGLCIAVYQCYIHTSGKSKISHSFLCMKALTNSIRMCNSFTS